MKQFFKNLFYSLFITFILIAILEFLRPNFASNFINTNWFFLGVVASGILTLAIKPNKIKNMIDGVKIKKIKTHNDVPDTNEPGERPGFLMEVLRDDEGLLEKFGQSTFTVAYPGTIKAFHWHKKQDDLWFFARGKALVVLYDLRDSSHTKGITQTIEADANNPQLIVIPKGVAHGYKALGDEPVYLFYHTTEHYNPEEPDEERIVYDDAKIGFDWGKSHNT